MNRKTLLAIAALLAFSGPLQAQPATNVDVMRAPGQVTATGTLSVTAIIVSLDAAKRTVKLRTDDGRIVELEVGEEARNFDQLKVGDTVTVTYKEALTVSLKKGGGALSMHERKISERAQPGARPGGTIGREVTVVADVVAVNADAKTVTVKGPRGNTVDLMVEDPEQLKAIKKGDRVHAVYTQAVAVAVEPAATAK